MALDWAPLPLPKPGHAEEFAMLLARVKSGDHTALDRLASIATPVFETLGAPRVGYDDEADEWLRTKVGEDDHYEMCMKMQGYYVLDLLPACDGFPVYTSSSWPKLDRYSFRGAVLDNVRDTLGALYHEAFHFKSANELEDYGERLNACARKFARRYRVMEIELVRLPPAGKAEARAHVIFAAARWCLYWSRRGHGLAPG